MGQVQPIAHNWQDDPFVNGKIKVKAISEEELLSQLRKTTEEKKLARFTFEIPAETLVQISNNALVFMMEKLFSKMKQQAERELEEEEEIIDTVLGKRVMERHD